MQIIKDYFLTMGILKRDAISRPGRVTISNFKMGWNHE